MHTKLNGAYEDGLLMAKPRLHMWSWIYFTLFLIPEQSWQLFRSHYRDTSHTPRLHFKVYQLQGSNNNIIIEGSIHSSYTW